MNNHSEILLLVETAVLCTAIAFLFLLWRKASFASCLLDNVMDASEYGKVIFDDRGMFRKTNSAGLACLSSMIDGCVKDLTQAQFLDYLYDFAADIDESIKNTILKNANEHRMPDFREVISLKNGNLFLVEAKRLAGSMTLFLLIDISAGQQREENIIQLNALNNQLMQAVQAMTSGIVISDPKLPSHPVLFANDAFCELVNREQTDLYNANWKIITDLIQDQEEQERFVAALSGGRHIDLVVEHRVDDKISYLSIKFTPVIDDNGALNLFIGVLSDITLLKQRESEVFHTQKLESLGQLAAGVAHDFNNILSIIGGYSVMAANFLEGSSPEVDDYLKRIHAASDRGASLTRKMLTFSRHKVVSQSVINICDVVREQQDLLLPLLDGNIHLEMNLSDSDMSIKGQADSIAQILMNLSINARDAMHLGGVLTIDTRPLLSSDVPDNIHKKINADEYVCLSISDEGTGMDQKTVARIFDPFFSTKDQGKGTGLGMSIVYGLVKEMGGLIDVSSMVGVGTTVSLYLPRVYENQTKVITGSSADLSTICLDGYTALVAEDEPDLLLLVTNMLEELGLNVLGAADGDEALVLLDDHMDEVDILLTDVVMPGINGVKLAELASALSPDVKIIFMSGYPANGDMAPVELPENITFIAKPVNYDNLAMLLLQKLRENVPGGGNIPVEEMPQWTTSDISEVDRNV